MKQHLFKIGFLLLAFAVIANTASAQSMMPLGENPENYTFDKSNKGEEDIPPTAKLKIRNDSGNIDMYSGTTSTVFTFDGNGSSDAETPGYLLEVRFDFENDGKLDTYYSKTKQATHKYDTPGIKTVRIDVLDLGGNVSSAYKQVIVVENTKPEAYFTVKPSIGTPGTEFRFDSSASKDDQYSNNLLEYRYDFDGDGNWDTKFSKIKSGNHYFETPGLKNVILEVRDPEGLSDYFRYTVYIKENTPPEAEFEVTKNKDGQIMVNAGDSLDKDGSPLKYRWDFDYNGKNDIQIDSGWFNSPIATFLYKKPGEYLVKLMVKDEDEATAFKVMRIFVDILS
jgi:PKD repeat protein